MVKGLTIAIDGPVASGKGTIARMLAEHNGLTLVDTGAMYRTVGFAMLRANVSMDEPEAIAAVLPTVNVRMEAQKSLSQRMFLDDKDVTDLLRTPEVSEAASVVSAVPAVRAKLLELQRNLAAAGDVVLDGRDIGTVVYPEAEIKVFLTATLEARARRRQADYAAKGIEKPLSAVMEEMEKRDNRDSSRDAAPLAPAADAVIIETDDQTPVETFRRVQALLDDYRAR